MHDDTDTLSPAEQAYLSGQGDLPGAEAETPVEQPKEPEPAKAEEPKAEEPKKEAEPEVTKLVPHGAFEEERQRRKEAQNQLRELRERLAFLEGQQQGQRPQEQPTEIDPEKNPIEAIRALKAEIQARKESEAQHQAMQGIVTAGQQYCREFAKSEPQFFGKDGQEGAYAFLRRAAAEKFAAQGVPAHEIEARVNLGEIKLINDALEQGMNPAVAMWHWAQVAGFRPQAAQPAPSAVNNEIREHARNDKGQFVKQPTEAEKIATREAAQAASLSLGSAPGGSGGSGPGLEDLLSMSDEEFRKTDWEKILRQGGR